MPAITSKINKHYATLIGFIPLMRAIFAEHQCHNGRYIVATPSYIWTGMLLTNFSDITENPAQAAGSLFQLDFVKPVEQSGGTLEKKTCSTLKGISEGKPL